MKQTPARTQFKQLFGQANHFMVTALVALHHLDESDVEAAPEELHTTWNPKDRKTSIRRTRQFTLQTILSSAVDAVDMYISLLHRKPSYIRDQQLCSALDGAHRSVQRKVFAVSSHYKLQPTTIALMDVLVTWRNNVVHELAENRLRQETREALENYQTAIQETYRGLDASSLPKKAERGDVLTFKEAASLVNAAHHFVAAVDFCVLGALDVQVLCSELVQDALKENGRAVFGAKYFSLQAAERRRFVRNWLATCHGLSNLDETVIDHCAKITRSVAP